MRRFGHWTGKVVEALLAALMLGMVMMVFGNVVLRYGFNSGIVFSEEMSRFCLIWMIMIGAVLAQKENSHFIVDVFPVLSPRATAMMELLTSVFVLIFSGVFVWWGIDFVEFAWFRTSELADIPLWWIHLPWPVLGVSWVIFHWPDLSLPKYSPSAT